MPSSSSLQPSTNGVSADAKVPGAWVPWPLVEAMVRLDLKPASCLRVFTVIFMTWCRYGCNEARLTTMDLASATGLGKRTVQAAVSTLLAQGLIERIGRYGRFRVAISPPKNMPRNVKMLASGSMVRRRGRGAGSSAPPTRTDGCASSTVSMFYSLEDIREGTFTDRQRSVITDVFMEASQLLGGDAGELQIPERDAVALGLATQTCYREALSAVVVSQNRKMARDYVRAVLALRGDERVQGRELIILDREQA